VTLTASDPAYPNSTASQPVTCSKRNCS
jgi:hypothetical protein